MKYILLYLVLNSLTGQPLEVGKVNTLTYNSLEECEKARAQFGPQKAKDGKVRVFACATPVTTL